jgi:hypothetical protein
MSAIVARPPLLWAALLFGLSLLGSHEPAPATVPAPRIELTHVELTPSGDVATLTPGWIPDMQDYPRGIVIRPPSTGDRIFAEVVAHWLSGLLHWVASRPA